MTVRMAGTRHNPTEKRVDGMSGRWLEMDNSAELLAGLLATLMQTARDNRWSVGTPSMTDGYRVVTYRDRYSVAYQHGWIARIVGDTPLAGRWVVFGLNTDDMPVTLTEPVANEQEEVICWRILHRSTDMAAGRMFLAPEALPKMAAEAERKNLPTNTNAAVLTKLVTDNASREEKLGKNARKKLARMAASEKHSLTLAGGTGSDSERLLGELTDGLLAGNTSPAEPATV